MVSPTNPYSPPGSAVADVKEPGLATAIAVPGRKVDAGRGVSWIGEGWTLFKAAPLLWIVALVILFGVQLLLGLVPILGTIVNYLIYPVFMLGVLVFAKRIAEGGQAEIGDLFTGFREKLGPLVAVGALYLLMIGALLLIFLGILYPLVGAPPSADPEAFGLWMGTVVSEGGLAQVLLAVLLASALGIPVAAAYWFAPGLVYYADLGAWAAMKESFRTCLRNWLPFLVYGVMMLLVMIGGAFLLLIGMFLISLPVLMASYYSSFSDLFGKKA